MNVVDIAILVILGAFLLKGLLRGLLKEFCSTVGLLSGAYLAFRFHPPLAEWLTQTLSLPLRFGVIISFVALLLSTILFFAVLGHLLSHFLKFTFLGGFNRVSGGLFGLVQGTLVLALVLFAISARPWPRALEPALERSELSPPFVHLGGTVLHGGLRIFSGQP
jgi:membrane protein required for colicin V production